MVAELKRLVWCDVCADDGDSSFPAVWESPIRLGDAPAAQVDLCDPHFVEYVGKLQALLDRLGRTPDEQLAQLPPRRGRKPTETCPVCGTGQSRKNMARHLRDVHGSELPGDFKCPECGRQFPRANSLGVHRRFAHGVIGQSAGAVDARATRAAARKSTGKPTDSTG